MTYNGVIQQSVMWPKDARWSSGIQPSIHSNAPCHLQSVLLCVPTDDSSATFCHSSLNLPFLPSPHTPFPPHPRLLLWHISVSNWMKWNIAAWPLWFHSFYPTETWKVHWPFKLENIVMWREGNTSSCCCTMLHFFTRNSSWSNIENQEGAIAARGEG